MIILNEFSLRPSAKRERTVLADRRQTMSLSPVPLVALGKSTNPRSDATTSAIVNDYIFPGAVRIAKGSTSQFHTTPVSRRLLPPMVQECCATFSALAVHCSVSLRREQFEKKFSISQWLDYLLYCASWLHQLSRESWHFDSDVKIRPLSKDVSRVLAGQDDSAGSGKRSRDDELEFCDAAIRTCEFDVVCYDQLDRAVEKICLLFAPGAAVKGYVIVSGEYCFGVACAGEGASALLLLYDSHGALPWAMSRCSVTAAVVDRGLHHFLLILTSLLDSTRRNATKTAAYTTWIPVVTKRQDRQLDSTLSECHRVLIHWATKDARGRREASHLGFKPRSPWVIGVA